MIDLLGYYVAHIGLASQILLSPFSSLGFLPHANPSVSLSAPAVRLSMAASPQAEPEVSHRAVVRHAANISNGQIQGSLWQLTGEDLSLSGNSTITEDLLVPGTPTVTTGGALSFAGVVIGSGSAEPSGYHIRLSGNAALRYVFTRTDPVNPSPVTAPPDPIGTRDVALSHSGESYGDPSSLRNLTLGGDAGEVSIPPGSYGAFAAGDQTAFVFGVAGSTEPSVYSLQSLSLSGQAKVSLLGSVILNIASAVTLSGNSELGAQTNSEWLSLRIAGGSFQLSGNSTAFAMVNAPAGSVTINGTSQLLGSLTCDALAVAGSSLLRATDAEQRVTVRHAAVVSNGRIEASVWQLAGEDFALSGNSVITGDLFVPGTPLVTTNGTTSYSGIIIGSGPPDPSGFNIKLSGNASLRFIMTRTDPIDLPAVEPPPLPTGTRDATLTKANDTLGDPATLRNLRLSGKAGAVPVPPGTYGAFTASSNAAFVLGVAGSPVPSVYNLQSLSLSGQAQVQLVGPVVINVAGAVTASGQAGIGSQSDPSWVVLRMAADKLEVSGGSAVYAIVHAPQSSVTISGGSQLTGALSCDSLKLSGNALLRMAIDNQAPTVGAGSNQAITLPQLSVNLTGTVSDDGLPADYLATTWSKVSGPGSVTFGDSSKLATTATFSSVGTYVLRLSATDGQLTGTSDVTITVVRPNLPPTVNAGPAQTITLPASATISGAVTDDGEPAGGVLLIAWSKVSGPGTVVFSSPNAAVTTASFSMAGIYVLRLTASDSQLSASADVTVTVKPANQPPMAEAGADQTVTLPGAAQLSGSATDDGLPEGSVLLVTWSKIQGPADVVFADPHGAVTTASFSKDGAYILQLSATDGVYTVVDIVSITVKPPAGPTLPPDPVTVAPQVDPTVATTMEDAVSFLYTGANPIQVGASIAAFNPIRLAVVRGMVLNRDGSPLPGATVSILNHPEFGHTLSRADGEYDMAVNGGGPLTVDIQKQGYLPAQRPVNVPWQDFAPASEVRMLALDPAVTSIDLAVATDVQVARGSVVTDADGARQASVLFTPGTAATMKLPDGSSQNLSTIHVRATEYSVGPTGPQSMPAPLPPQSGYTYAAEFSADEALAAGATEVQFSKPVVTYIDNFLRFPAGTIVPVGYYDRVKGLWIASDSGRVIKITAITNGLADIDTNGDGIADNDPALGFTDAERNQLAALYTAGLSLWRVQITHFSPWDCNWPVVPPPDATGPGQPAPGIDTRKPDPCLRKGSIIECQNQILRERVNVAGTAFTLNYQSDRMPGHRTESTAEVSASGASLPQSLKRIDVLGQVAGQQLKKSLDATPNQNITLAWDGKDPYGRPLQGGHTITIDIGYVYPAVYVPATRFGFNSNGVPVTGDPARDEITFHQTFVANFEGAGLSFGNQAQGLGGWTLDINHSYDPVKKVLLLGNGELRSAEEANFAIKTTAGGGENVPEDGSPATEAQLVPNGITVGPDGSLYIADTSRFQVLRVGRDGVIHRVAGTATGESCNLDYSSCGEEGPALEAQLTFPGPLAVGPDNSLYIGDMFRILKVDPDGIIHRVAGGNVNCLNQPNGQCGDNGPAIMAQLSWLYSLALGPDGSLYLNDSDWNRIRRIDPAGTIHTVAGTGSWGFSGDGGPATLGGLANPTGVAVDSNGNLYIADLGNRRIRRVRPDGIINTVAGTGLVCNTQSDPQCGDNGPALQANVQPRRVAVSPDGRLVVSDLGSRRIRFISPDGTIHSVAGGGSKDAKDGGSAGQANLSNQWDVVFSPDDSVMVSTWNAGPVSRVASNFPDLGPETIIVPSEDGSEAYQFDGRGRHLLTINQLTHAVLYQFGYTPDGLLATITDGDGSVTSIERNANGTPTAIVGFYGQRTLLALDEYGYLAKIADPNGRATTMTYTPDGLLKTFQDPNGHQSRMSYDELGRLTKDEDAAGGFSQIQRTTSGIVTWVDLTTAMGSRTRYQTDREFQGASRRVNTLPDGTISTQVINSDDSSTTSTSDGTQFYLVQGPDPRFGMMAPVPSTSKTTMPSGLSLTINTTRSAVLKNTNDPQSLKLTETSTINSRTHTSTYDMPTRTSLSTSPTGRQSSSTIDAQGRVTRQQIAGLDPVDFSYDARGRLSSVTHGSGAEQRITSFTYNANGYLEEVTDALNRVVRFDYDDAGRVKNQWLPDGRLITNTYDAGGNLISITPPSRPAHGFSHTPVDLVSVYTPPNIGAGANLTTYQYNLDRQPTLLNRPDGQTISFNYDTGGRLSTIATPSGQYTYSYDTKGRVAGLSAPGGQTLGYSYDGSLPLSTTWSGAFNASVSRTFDNNLWVRSQSVNGSNAVSFTYDNDSLLTSAGSLSLARDPQNGLLTGTTLGSITDSWTYSSFGEPTGYSATTSGAATYSVSYTRDKLGRITDKSETMAGTTVPWHYAYDDTGKLTDVQQNGALASHYEYDANGNRTRAQYPLLAADVSATYDDQDRMLTYGPNTYSYTANGELASKTNAGGTTTYNYDVLGNLRSVTLPGGTAIEYVVDAQNRRIGKKVNGALTQGFAYDGQLQIVAELDGSGNVISRFVYGDRGNVPSYMIKGGITYRIIADQLGSPRLVVNSANGAVAQRIDYDEFGNILADTNPGFQPFAFAGGLNDQLTRLIHFGARDYDPEAGRWTAKDPISFAGGDTNLYGYALNDPINVTDINGMDLLQGTSDFVAGMGDVLSLGATNVIRNLMGTNQAVNKCSGAYGAGQWTGFGLSTAIGFAGGVEAAGTKAAGREFSHWIPERWGGPRSVFNGNYVTAEAHALSDPYRYNFMSAAWKDANPLPNLLLRQGNRFPIVYKGGAIGAAYGAAGLWISNAAKSGCGCK
jgi:RHS repeat-associated protein